MNGCKSVSAMCALRWSWQTSRRSITVPSWSVTFSSCPKGAPPTCPAWWTPWWNCASAATTPTSSMVSHSYPTSSSVAVNTATIPTSLFISHCQYYSHSYTTSGQSQLLYLFISSPEGRLGMSDVSPRLESQGCHLIPLCYLLSCSSA